MQLRYNPCMEGATRYLASLVIKTLLMMTRVPKETCTASLTCSGLYLAYIPSL